MKRRRRISSFAFCICLSKESTTNKCRLDSRRQVRAECWNSRFESDKLLGYPLNLEVVGLWLTAVGSSLLMAMYLTCASCTLHSAVPVTLSISVNFPGSLSSALPLSMRRGQGRGHVKFGCCFRHARPLAACVCYFLFFFSSKSSHFHSPLFFVFIFSLRLPDPGSRHRPP